MNNISPTQLFNEQLKLIGEARALTILANFIPTKKMFRQSLRHINIDKLYMKVKVKNLNYFVKYTFDKKEKDLVVDKLLMR